MAEYYKGKTIDPDTKGKFIKIEGERYPYKKERGKCFYDPGHDYDKISKENCKGLSGHDPIQLGIAIIDNHQGTKKLEKIRRQHVRELKKGVNSWNKWRINHPHVRPILYELNKENKQEIKVKDLQKVNFSNANLIESDLTRFNLAGANFHEANLGGAKLIRAILKGANFCRTDLYRSDLSGADLTKANLQGAQMAGTRLRNADGKETKIINCKVYGSSAWDIEGLDDATQKNLEIIYKLNENEESVELQVDDLAMAQFLYFILNNKNLPKVFKATNSSIVLILGRFTEDRKKVLDRIRESLRKKTTKKKYVPIIFDFKKPEDRGYNEVITVLAGISRFIIADLTNPKSIPQELQAIVSEFQIPLIPIINKPEYVPNANNLDDKGESELYSMFVDYYKYNWVHPVIEYFLEDDLFNNFNKLIDKAEEFHKKIIAERNVKKDRMAISTL